MSLNSLGSVGLLGLAAFAAAGCGGATTAVDGAVAGDATTALDATASSADAAKAAEASGATGTCATDDDCQLVNDCCSCEAIPRGENAPACDSKRSCVMPICAQYPGVDHARCSAGRCLLGFDCDPTMIACKRLPPVCPPGQTPQVVGQGGARCYGACVDARQCLTVPACGACRPTDECARPDASTALHCLGPATTNLGER
jgi:hypothetical protein